MGLTKLAKIEAARKLRPKKIWGENNNLFITNPLLLVGDQDVIEVNVSENNTMVSMETAVITQHSGASDCS